MKKCLKIMGVADVLAGTIPISVLVVDSCLRPQGPVQQSGYFTVDVLSRRCLFAKTLISNDKSGLERSLLYQLDTRLREVRRSVNRDVIVRYPGASVFVLIVLTTVALCSCGGGADGGVEPLPNAFVRLVNAVPDSPALRFSTDDTLRATLSFGEASPFVRVFPDVPIEVAAEYESGDGRITLVSSMVTISQGRDFTVIVAGSINSPRVISIDNPGIDFANDTGEAEFQFAHAAVNAAESIDVFIDEGAAQSGTPDVNVSFQDISDMLVRPAAGFLEFRLRDAEDDIDLWSSGPYELTPSTRRLFLIVDYFGPGDADARVLRIGEAGARLFPQEDLPAAIRVANLIPDQGPLDVRINRVSFAQNVRFGEVIDYSQTPSAEIAVQVTPFGQPGTMLAEQILPETAVPPGAFLTLTLSGIEDDYNMAVTVDDRRRVPLRPLVSVTHGAPSVNATGQTGNLDVYFLDHGETLSGQSPAIPALGFLNTAASFPGEGVRDLVLTGAGTGDLVLGPLRLDINNNGLYRIFAADSEGGGLPVEVILADDFAD